MFIAWLLAFVSCQCAFGADEKAATQIIYPENRPFRAADFTPADANWVLAGEDASHFCIEDGILRFCDAFRRIILPDYENPADVDQDNLYHVTALSSSASQIVDLQIKISDVNEPGAVSISDSRPGAGEPLIAQISDPDGVFGEVAWRWQRSAGAGQWMPVAGAVGASYTPEAADTTSHLRAIAVYRDSHGAGQRAQAATPAPVIGPRLARISASLDSNRETKLYPEFDPDTLHYGIACAEKDVLTLELYIEQDARIAVNGIQPHPAAKTGAAVIVDEASKTKISVYRTDGSETVYHTLHARAACRHSNGKRAGTPATRLSYVHHHRKLRCRH